MREIKFKLWDSSEKEMWIALIVRHTARGMRCVTVAPLENEADHTGVQEWDWDYSDKDILMQYTGLKDKNGVEIYEGDIVKKVYDCYKEPLIEIKKIEYVEEHGAFRAVKKDNFNCTAMEEHNEFEVIGNIYEDKDLLEEEE